MAQKIFFLTMVFLLLTLSACSPNYTDPETVEDCNKIESSKKITCFVNLAEKNKDIGICQNIPKEVRS